MDRLIIESTLSDVSEISTLENDQDINFAICLILNYKAANVEQVNHAFSALKQLQDHYPVDILVCKTMVTGLYDFEIKTAGLDEPIRIMNKPISAETVNDLEDQISKNEGFILGTNVSGQENWITINALTIKDCEGIR